MSPRKKFIKNNPKGKDSALQEGLSAGKELKVQNIPNQSGIPERTKTPRQGLRRSFRQP